MRLAVLAFTGCSHAAADGEIPCDVARVLEAKCLRCHGAEPRHGAPYRFTSLSRIREVRGGKPVFERIELAIEEDFMPPLEVEDDPPVAPLDVGERATLVGWTSAGAPSGDACR